MRCPLGGGNNGCRPPPFSYGRWSGRGVCVCVCAGVEALRCGVESRRLHSEAVTGSWCSNLGREIAAVALRSRDRNDGAMPAGFSPSLVWWAGSWVSPSPVR